MSVYLLYSNYTVESKEILAFIGQYNLWQYIIPICCDSVDAHKIVGSKILDIPSIVISDGKNFEFHCDHKLRAILKRIYDENNSPPQMPNSMLVVPDAPAIGTLQNSNNMPTTTVNKHVRFAETNNVAESPHVDNFNTELAETPIDETAGDNLSQLSKNMVGNSKELVKKLAKEQQRLAEQFNESMKQSQ